MSNAPLSRHRLARLLYTHMPFHVRDLERAAHRWAADPATAPPLPQHVLVPAVMKIRFQLCDRIAERALRGALAHMEAPNG